MAAACVFNFNFNFLVLEKLYTFLLVGINVGVACSYSLGNALGNLFLCNLLPRVGCK